METVATLYIIYAENTPNPATLKFISNQLLAKDNASFEFTNISETNNAPLVNQLFKFPYVKRVFISANFIAVTKDDSVDWNDVAIDMRSFIQDYLNSGKKILNTVVADNLTKEEDHSNVEQEITNILEQYVRPAVERDGGAIQFKSFDDGVVTVILKGACSGCPSATYTLKAGIENLLIRMVPEVKEVVAEQF